VRRPGKASDAARAAAADDFRELCDTVNAAVTANSAAGEAQEQQARPSVRS
jgi:hypothetical protein